METSIYLVSNITFTTSKLFTLLLRTQSCKLKLEKLRNEKIIRAWSEMGAAAMFQKRAKDKNPHFPSLHNQVII